jgi:hypothetical protein
MKTKRLVVVFCLFFFLGLHSGKGYGSESCDLVEKISDQGYVNWSTGVVAAQGQGAAPEKYYGTPQASSMALRAAQLNANRNLFEVTKGVRIDSETTVGELMAQDGTIEAQMKEMVKSAEIVKKEYLSDGTVGVTLNMSLYGGFAQLILPKDVKQLPEIKTIDSDPAVSDEDEKTGGPEEAARPDDGISNHESSVCTGLVIDARGLTGQPAMAPKVFDESGQEVYGSAYVSREFAVNHGMTGYTKDVTAAKGDSRVADDPFAVKGLGPKVPGGSDFIISNSDAAKIRSSSQNLSLLRQCRVLIVLD